MDANRWNKCKINAEEEKLALSFSDASPHQVYAVWVFNTNATNSCTKFYSDLDTQLATEYINDF